MYTPAGSGVTGEAAPIVNDASRLGPELPHAVPARTRMKYWPGGAGDVSVVTFGSANVPRLLRPDADPASSAQAVGAPPLAGEFHLIVTLLPDGVAVTPVGGTGACSCSSE